jgi:hypothetical protein
MKTDTEITASQIIDALGGPTKVAGETGLTKGAISNWRKNNIPDGWLAYFRVTRPHLFAAPPKKRAGK